MESLMRVTYRNSVQQFTIDPGELFTSGENVIISTLLGSCVSACVYDPIKRVIGMNHFLLANRRYARHLPVIQSEVGRYGIHAMELLINNLLKHGARRENLRAKAFGGGNVLKARSGQDSFYAVGDVNSRFIQEFLSNDRIPLVASDLGGDSGRVIFFAASDFSVYVRKIDHSRDAQVVREERQFWNTSIREHERDREQEQIEIWD